ncbi:DNA polymerase III subunit alpha [Frankia sp. R43]|uniref:DNA polymerase III subunit alpha n=1 Tax=Frankia sp. R43 TaxID=269536 RepID=UPI0007C718CF|nr:DNA polymerase III subunit alpha [Frankia sp. R43]
MSPDQFVHLHVHTDHSMLDGAARIKDLVAEAARLGMPAVGMTDHGTMSGAYDLHRAATKAGITPVIGIEAYVAPAGREHKAPVFWGGAHQRSSDQYGEGGDVSGAGAYTHMTMLAANATGLRNLFRLSSTAWAEGYYRKPRMDAEVIARHAGGIIATTGCPSGEVQTRLRLGQPAEALRAAETYLEIFGREHYFLELMDHGLAIERSVRDGLLGIGRRLGLAPLATNDSHYVTADQAGAHDALLCVQSGSKLTDAKRFRFDGNGYYLKSASEMRALWDDQVPGATDSTLLIAEMVGDYGEVFAHRDLMPAVPLPDGATPASHLRAEVAAGLARRYPGGVPSDRRERADYELDVICGRSLETYMLLVADITREARERGIRVNARGSAVGSIVAYALGITGMDPITYKLLFERFINPERPSMPDIDLDVDEHRRGELIAYVADRYGHDRVAQIITFGTIKAKAAVRDAARVLGVPFAVGDKITKALPPAVMGKDVPLAAVDDPKHPRHGEAAAVRTMRETDPVVGQVLDTAAGLEGLIRQAGVHAAGVIVSREPLVDVLPVWRHEDGATVTGFDYPTCEAMGLLKIDFLGLRNLGLIEATLAHIRRTRGEDIDLDAVPLDDPATFALLSRGETLGVFQLDGGPIRVLLRAMEPSEFEHISAVLALYRPGPMGAGAHTDYAERKNGRQEIRPIHPELAEPLADILGDTYGLIVYQEQVMAIAQAVAGYSLGKADLLRRAMGKKKKEVLDAEFEPFSAGMRERGYSDEAITTLWDILVPFSDYAFNRAHTAGYGMVSYWTAYLKANYPAEYMAAVLTSVGDNKDRMAVYLAECRRMGVKVLPPDVNTSELDFTPAAGTVRFGLGAVRGIGSGVVEAIVAARAERGLFGSFTDFLDKAEATACTKRAVSSLVQAGAFDSLGHHRRPLFDAHEAVIAAAVPAKRYEDAGHLDLFAETAAELGEDAPARPGESVDLTGPEWPRAELLAREREMLGLYVSGHPLHGTQELLERHSTVALSDLEETTRDGQEVHIAGLISAVERKVSKSSGNPWAPVTLEDLGGIAEVLFFSRTYQECGHQLAVDAVVSIRGRVNVRDGAVSVVADALTVLDPATATADQGPVGLALDATAVTPDLVERLRVALEAHPGHRPVRMRVLGEGGRWTLTELGPRVAATRALRAELERLLGTEAVAHWPVNVPALATRPASRWNGQARRGHRPRRPAAA